jgi:hypothetical protein
MVNAALLLASSKPADGRVVLAIGLVMLTVSVVEIVARTRRPTTAGWLVRVWAGRVFAIAVWLLMIAAGVKLLIR